MSNKTVTITVYQPCIINKEHQEIGTIIHNFDENEARYLQTIGRARIGEHQVSKPASKKDEAKSK